MGKLEYALVFLAGIIAGYVISRYFKIEFISPQPTIPKLANTQPEGVLIQ